MDIRPQVRALAQQLYPGLSAKQLGSRINDDLFQVYLDRLRSSEPETDQQHGRHERTGEEIGAKEITERIAGQAPAMDFTNLALIRRGIQDAIDCGKWNATAEQQLLDTLNDPFDKANNERRVQNSRIRYFFEWLMS